MLSIRREKYNIDNPVVITTWQSIYKEPVKWFDQFDVVIGDEAHQFKSKSLVDIMSKLLDCKYRFGFTGTLDGTQTHKWVLEGLFGPSYKVTETKKLMDQGYLLKWILKLLLKHRVKSLIMRTKSSISYNAKKGTTSSEPVLYRVIPGIISEVESHGEVLYDLVNKSKSKNRRVFLFMEELILITGKNLRITERKRRNHYCLLWNLLYRNQYQKPT